jgi:proteasome assembly chaperone (PAC2) family protein
MESGLQAISLWGHAPAYLQKNPRLVARIVSILGKAMGFHCPVETLKRKAVELDRKISDALARDPNLKQLVESIEEKDISRRSSGRDDKIIHLNDFLRRDPHEDADR